MSTMTDTKPTRIRRSFSKEFKASAVRLVLEEGKSVCAAARDLAGGRPPRYSVLYGGIDAINARMTEQHRTVSLRNAFALRDLPFR
jgi:hypothetical protein